MFIIIGLILVATPFISRAASIWTDGLVPCSGLNCTSCDIFQLLKNILDLIWDGSWVVASAMLIYGGFMYMQNSPDKAKKIITNTIIGIAIAFFGWLAVDTVIKIVADKTVSSGEKTVGKLGLGPWNEINLDCTSIRTRGSLGIVAPTLKEESTGGPGQGNVVTPAGEETARARLESFGISVNNPISCPTNVRYQDVPGSCTSVGGLPSGTIATLGKIKSDCDCAIRVTGGSELGHLSHGQGKPVVDISFNAAAARFIKDNAADYGIYKICTTPEDSAYRINCDYNESVRHLHLEFTSQGGSCSIINRVQYVSNPTPADGRGDCIAP